MQTTYHVSYTIFLNCIRGKNPRLCMLGGNAGNADTDFSGARISPALISPKFHPKPSWVPLHHSQCLLPDVPTAGAGQVRATFLTAWEAAPVQKPAWATPSKRSAGVPRACRGNSALNSVAVLAGDKAAGKHMCREGAARSGTQGTVVN